MSTLTDRTGSTPGASTRQIAVIGAGYAGLFAARRAARAARDGTAHVTLIDPAPAWVERTRLHQLASGADGVAATPLGDLFDSSQVTTVAGAVQRINTDERTLTVASTTDDGRDRDVPYDRLVYALGSSSDTAGTPGAAEHAHVLDSAVTARHLERRLEELGHDTARRVAVVGGGLTGIETAAEIAEAHPHLAVTLLSAGEIGAGVSERARLHLRRSLHRLGVEVLAQSGVTHVESDGLITTDGRRIDADVVVWAAGLAVPDLAQRAGLATDDRGRVLVDASLRSTSHPEILAAGDCAWPVEHVGAPVRPSAYVSTIMGAHAGTTIARELAGKRARPLAFGYLLQAVSLGRRDGVVQFTDGLDRPLRWVATGRLAALLKELVERVMVVGLLRLERRVPGAFAWRPAPRRSTSTRPAAATRPAEHA